MLLRLLLGVGFATCLLMLFLVALGLYLHFFWAPAHPGLGAVAGGISYSAMCLMPPAFIAGFVWDWRHSKHK
jgi:hypothetical protein